MTGANAHQPQNLNRAENVSVARMAEPRSSVAPQLSTGTRRKPLWKMQSKQVDKARLPTVFEDDSRCEC